MKFLTYIKAPNTSSGNPQRGWIISDATGNFERFIDEGYEGRGAISKELWEGAQEINSGYGIVVPSPEYKRWKKMKSEVSASELCPACELINPFCICEKEVK